MREKRSVFARLWYEEQEKTGQVQIIIVTNRQLNLTQLVKDLVKDFPEVVTVAVNTNTAKTSEIYGEKTEIIWGQESIQEGVLDYEFSLSPRAFINLIRSRQKFSIVKQLRLWMSAKKTI